VGLVLIELTGVVELDAVVALMVASAIVYAGVRILSRSSRVLMDEALPASELEIVRRLVEDYPGAELVGHHKLRGRRAGSARHIDLHLQFEGGTSLERAHAIAHELQEQVRARIRNADLLVHIEPARKEDRRRGLGRKRSGGRASTESG
jgi:divalent metal cation (Fe/Co/Zn/Cd) transporter